MKIKSFVFALLIISMLVPFFSVILYANQDVKNFIDITEGSWYYDHVMYAYENEIMAGISESEFLPHGELTRAMAVQMLYSMAGKPVENMSWGNPYDDTSKDAWYYDAVLWAYLNNISRGVYGGNFAPDAPITRAELSVMLLRYARLNSLKLPEIREPNAFADKTKIPDYARLEASVLSQAGIISGKPGNLFDPKGKTTRAEAAVMFSEFIKKAEEQSFDLLAENGCSFGALNRNDSRIPTAFGLGFNSESIISKCPEKIEVVFTTRQGSYEIEPEIDYQVYHGNYYSYQYRLFTSYDDIYVSEGESVVIELTVHYGEESETYTLYLAVPFRESILDDIIQ